MTGSPVDLLGVYLFVKDLDATVAFYETLGLAIERVSPVFARAVMPNGATLELGAAELTRSYDPSWREPTGPGTNTINFQLPSRAAVDATYQRLVSAGFVGHLPPCDPPWQARFAIVDDPDGNIVGLHSPRDREAEREREKGSGQPRGATAVGGASMASGTCLCGTFAYTVEGAFGDVRYCHCSQCRRSSGTAFSANARIHRSQWSLRGPRGQITEYEHKPGLFKAFCSKCGSPLYARSDHDPDDVRVRLGGFEGELDARVTGHVWVGSKASWYEIEDSIACYPEAIGRRG